jgi:predicted transcriptional regulator
MQQLTHPALDENHTLRQTTQLMIDTNNYTITVTHNGKPTTNITIQDILNAIRQGKNTRETRLTDIL